MRRDWAAWESRTAGWPFVLAPSKYTWERVSPSETALSSGPPVELEYTVERVAEHLSCFAPAGAGGSQQQELEASLASMAAEPAPQQRSLSMFAP